MKIFEQNGKVNFVDDANVFVGFDYQQDCCESFGWSLTNEPPKALEVGPHGIDPTGYNFDTAFFDDRVPESCYVEDGGLAIFRLTRGETAIYLTLWNSHNGYYGHGFEMTLNGQNIRNGCL